MLETLDKSIGTILDTLEDLELENNTLVVFNSDNGQKGSKQGRPFRGSKGDLYERVVFVCHLSFDGLVW